MMRSWKTLAARLLPAALLTLLASGEAGAATAINVAFQFEGLEITDQGGSLNIGLLSLAGPITENNIDLVELGTTLNLDNPLPVGVGDKFKLGWDTLAGSFTDSVTETSVTGNFNSLLTVVATGMISGSSETGPSYGPTPSKLTLDFVDGGLNGSFTTLTSLAPVPETSTWVMLILGFAGLALSGVRRAEALFHRNAA